MENNDDDTVPLQYINNENPYAFCHDYHRNSINLPEKRTYLNALLCLQPVKISFRMPQKDLHRERQFLISEAVNYHRHVIIKRGLQILEVEYHDNPEMLFEQQMDNEEIMDILLQLQKFKLIEHQKRLRAKVSLALSKKLTGEIEYNVNSRKKLEIDNLKEALIFNMLEDLYKD